MRGIIVILAVLGMGFAVILGLVVGTKHDPYSPLEVARAEALAREAAAEDVWRTAWRPAGLVLQGLLGGVVVIGLAAAVIVGARWLDMRARCVYPDAHGIMPAVILRPGEVLADAGGLPAPLVINGATGPTFPTIAAGDLARLQAGANQAAGLTRTMRAWASREVGTREAAQPAPWALPAGRAETYPPVEVLTGDEAHVYRLLEGDNGE